jgi:hypothetical protein
MPPRLAPRRLSFSDNSPLANLAAGIRAFGAQHNFLRKFTRDAN